MQTKDKRLLLRILFAVFFVLAALVAVFEWSIWQFNRLSPQFRTVAKPAFEAIRQCEPSTGQSAACRSALETAENKLPMLHAAARTQGDRRAAYLIQAYLHETEKCRHDQDMHEVSDGPNNSCHEMLRYGADLKAVDEMRMLAQSKLLPMP